MCYFVCITIGHMTTAKPKVSRSHFMVSQISQRFEKCQVSLQCQRSWIIFYVLQELDEIRKSGMKNFRNIQVDESNILTWQGLIVPVSLIGFNTANVFL